MKILMLCCFLLLLPLGTAELSIITPSKNTSSVINLQTPTSTTTSTTNNSFNATYATLLNQLCPEGKVVNGTLANGTFICTTVSGGNVSLPQNIITGYGINNSVAVFVDGNLTGRSNFTVNFSSGELRLRLSRAFYQAYNIFGGNTLTDSNWPNHFVSDGSRGIAGFISLFSSTESFGSFYTVKSDNSRGFLIGYGKSSQSYDSNTGHLFVQAIGALSEAGYLYLVDGYGELSEYFGLRVGGDSFFGYTDKDITGTYKVNVLGKQDGGMCLGTPNACNTFLDESSCLTQLGCSWDNDLSECSGTPNTCESIIDDIQCPIQLSCSWDANRNGLNVTADNNVIDGSLSITNELSVGVLTGITYLSSYANIALTNISNIFTQNQTITGRLNVSKEIRTQQLYIINATNNGMDRCTLVSGKCKISNTRVTNNTNIICFAQTGFGGTASVNAGQRQAGNHYNLTSSNVLDTSTYACLLVEPQ